MKNMTLGELVGAIIIGLCFAFVWLIFIGWVVTVIIGWFGPDLAVWQGMVIAVVIHLLGGGAARS